MNKIIQEIEIKKNSMINDYREGDRRKEFDRTSEASGYVSSVRDFGFAFLNGSRFIKNWKNIPVPDSWPFPDGKNWSPKSPREDLIHAAALIIGEIERLDKIEESKKNNEYDD